MIDKDFIEKIVELRDEGEVVIVEGQAYSAKGLAPIVFEPRAKTLCVNTLSGLVAFVKENIDSLKNEQLYIHVESPKKVSLISSLAGKKRERDTFVTAFVDEALKEFQFGQYIQTEDFIIKLRSLFTPSRDVDRLISYTSKLSSGTTVTQEDDGITQTATVKKGVSGSVVKEETAPVIVALAPYRTFREIDQVESQFLFRIKQNGENKPECALFEADGGIWRGDAIESIKAFFVESRTGIAIIA